MKLEKLTIEQEAKAIEVRDYWIDYIMSCKNSVDKEKAKIGIDWLYKLAGKDEPIIIHVDSPMGCQIAVNYLKAYVKALPKILDPASVGASVGASVRDSVRASVWASVRASVWASVGASVRDSVRASVRDSVGASVRDSVRASVGASVRDSVWDSVGASVRDSVGASVGASVRDSVGASVWASVRASVGDSKLEYNSFSYYGNIGDYGWVSFYDFFTQIGVINHDGFNKFKNVISSGIYDTIQLNGFCIVSNLPTKIRRDDRNRLHNPDGAAIEFKDGYNQYYWHGVSVIERWILNPESITKEELIKEGNAEKRRCIMEILGENKYALLLDLETIETDEYNGQEVSLMKTIKKDNLADDYVYFIKVICNSTLRNYYLCIPKEAFNLGAIGALAWTFGMSAPEYQVLIET